MEITSDSIRPLRHRRGSVRGLVVFGERGHTDGRVDFGLLTRKHIEALAKNPGPVSIQWAILILSCCRTTNEATTLF